MSWPIIINLRGHVLDDAVEQVKALVVIGLGGNELLENSKQARLRRKDEQDKSQVLIYGQLKHDYFLCCTQHCHHSLFYRQQSWQ